MINYFSNDPQWFSIFEHNVLILTLFIFSSPTCFHQICMKLPKEAVFSQDKFPLNSIFHTCDFLEFSKRSFLKFDPICWLIRSDAGCGGLVWVAGTVLGVRASEVCCENQGKSGANIGLISGKMCTFFQGMISPLTIFLKVIVSQWKKRKSISTVSNIILHAVSITSVIQ